MIHKYRALIVGLLSIALCSCVSKPPVPPVPSQEPRSSLTGRVEVTVNGLEGDEGQVLIALFLDASGWPGETAHAFAVSTLPIQNNQVVTAFENVPAGPFAISVFHDKNGDRKLDTGPFGIPSEPYGFSRDARGELGPPSFDQARLDLPGAQSISVSIRVE
jgi:uncharacterized protein (DUF2141 family)